MKIHLGNTGQNAALVALEALENTKAEDITLIPLPESAIAEAFIIATGNSDRHVGSLARDVAAELKEKGYEILGIEGSPANAWVVVDAGDVIIHVFQEEARELYNLEKMWGHSFDSNDDTDVYGTVEMPASA